MQITKWSRECCFAKKRAARCSHSRLKVVELVGYCGFSFEIELVKYLTETACNLEKIIIGRVDRRRSRFGVDQQYNLEKEKVLTRALAQDLKEKLPASVEVNPQTRSANLTRRSLPGAN
ncbi:hypothetical protein ACLB2K_005963 [Fragaria x ananassa]